MSIAFPDDFNEKLGEQMRGALSGYIPDTNSLIGDALASQRPDVKSMLDTALGVPSPDLVGINFTPPNPAQEFINAMEAERESLWETINNLQRDKTAGLIKAATGINKHYAIPDAARMALSGLNSPSAQMAALINFQNFDTSGALAALGKNADVAGVSTQIADFMNEHLGVSTGLVERLAVKADILQPKSWEVAVNIARADPEIRENVKSFVEEHPDEVDDLAEKITNKPSRKEKSETIRTGHLSRPQRLTLYKEALNMLGQSAITSFTAVNPQAIVWQITLSVVVFIFAIAEIEVQIREEGRSA